MKFLKYITIILVTSIFSCACDSGDDDPQVEPPASTNKYLLWVDATANFSRLSNSQDSIAKYVQMAKDAGFTDLVVDVRPISGEVLYNSTITPGLKSWRDFTRTATFDYLQAFVDAAKQSGLNVYASINTFTGGHLFSPFWGEADAGTRPSLAKEHPEWISKNYFWNGSAGQIESMWTYYKNGRDGKTAAFMNPVNPEVRAHMLSIIGEIASKYDVKGVILDRGRYDGIGSDFSDLSRSAFETYIGQAVINWPDDIYRWTSADSRAQGPHYKKWLEFRASVIYSFFREANQKVSSSGKEFATYVGAWYSSYYHEGVNWASKTYDPSLTYSWATPEYKNYGYAEELDFIITGCYSATVSGVQNYINQSQTALNGAIPMAGGLYIEDYNTLESRAPQSGKNAFRDCLMANRKGATNIMIFDMVQLNEELYRNGTTPKYWDVVKSILK